MPKVKISMKVWRIEEVTLYGVVGDEIGLEEWIPTMCSIEHYECIENHNKVVF